MSVMERSTDDHLVNNSPLHHFKDSDFSSLSDPVITFTLATRPQGFSTFHATWLGTHVHRLQAKTPSLFSLQLSQQSGRGVLSEHDEFDQLHLLSLIELFVVEKSIQLGLGHDRIRNGDIVTLGERLQELGVLPMEEVKSARVMSGS